MPCSSSSINRGFGSVDTTNLNLLLHMNVFSPRTLNMFSPLSPRDTRSDEDFLQAVEYKDIEHAVKQWTDPNWHLNRLPNTPIWASQIE